MLVQNIKLITSPNRQLLGVNNFHEQIRKKHDASFERTRHSRWTVKPTASNIFLLFITFQTTSAINHRFGPMLHSANYRVLGLSNFSWLLA